MESDWSFRQVPQQNDLHTSNSPTNGHESPSQDSPQQQVGNANATVQDNLMTDATEQSQTDSDSTVPGPASEDHTQVSQSRQPQAYGPFSTLRQQIQDRFGIGLNDVDLLLLSSRFDGDIAAVMAHIEAGEEAIRAGNMFGWNPSRTEVPDSASDEPVTQDAPVTALPLGMAPVQLATMMDAAANTTTSDGQDHGDDQEVQQENGEEDEEEDEDGDGAQDGNTTTRPQQPVNWAPTGIDNMNPDWVHSVDASAESYDCKICTDAPTDTERIFLDCGHVFCASCLNENFRHALTSRANFPPRCCRNQSINFDVAQFYLEEDVMVLALQNWEEWSAPDPTYCQTPGCTGGLIFDHFVVDQWALCKTCGNKTCTECKALESGHESPNKHPNTLTEEDSKLIKKEGWKQCPKCRKVIERVDGCDHMQCTSCQTHFCYRCGGNLQNGMGCNCEGQNLWVAEVQADIDGAHNGDHHHSDDDDDDDHHEDDSEETSEIDTDTEHDGDQDNQDPAQQQIPNIHVVADVGWGTVDQTPPVPVQPTTMTVNFNDIQTITGDGWIPAPAPQRNQSTGALEWVFTRAEDQEEDNTTVDGSGNHTNVQMDDVNQ